MVSFAAVREIRVHDCQCVPGGGRARHIKVLVGGPVSQDFADEIGADGYALDTGAAARKTKEPMTLGV